MITARCADCCKQRLPRALGRADLTARPTGWLDALRPEPLGAVLAREDAEREAIAARLAG